MPKFQLTRRNSGNRKSGRVTTKDVAAFTRQLALMLDAGLDIRSALQVTADVTVKQTLHEAIQRVNQDVQVGVPLSEALGKHALFDRFIVEMVRAGEATGDLVSVLRRATTHLEKQIKMRQTIQKATLYPAVTLGFSLIAVVIMLAVVVPQFVTIVDGLGGELPGITQAVIDVSEFVQANFFVLAGVVALALFITSYGRRLRVVRAVTDRMLLNLPIIGPVVRANALVQWSSSLAFCLHAGLDIRASLDVTRRLIRLTPYDDAIRDVRRRVSDGDALAAALKRHPKLFPNLVLGVVRVGEQSGELEAPLTSAAAFFEDEVETLASSIGSAMEPFLMVFIGGIVGTVVVAMMLPMVSALQGAGGF